ncbi:L-type lectin-domain containing receptor kinase IV.2 [Dichanthelium oligosanthes]|uniref:non-specific serine/threonine protein kinase n=1 Tax=Dichanthelium oligosanthes TaxID=888268 RepID=A0A1E5VCA1_9POAL|nr:L-type lectin-domain containing receptor kinase IV.2 [Dichanthelium oligosanthes]
MLLQLCAALVLLIVPAYRCAAATGGSSGHQFVYNGFAGESLSLDGSATVTPNGLLMLTNGTIQMKGHAFHPSPLPFRYAAAAQNATTARSFSTTFVFAIYGPYGDLSSHGLAFFVSADKELLSTALPGQFLGLLNNTDNGSRSAHVFAVEFDTLLNADFRDINSNHVGINVDSLRSIDAADAGYYDDGTGRFQNLSLVGRKAMQVWVDYDGGATQVTVTVAPLGVPRPKKPLLRTIVDLSEVVQSTAYVGFTSATGVLFSRHFVAGWSFALDVPAPALNVTALPALPRAGSKPRSKVLEIVLPIASVTLLLTVGVLICTVVRRRIKYAEVREDWEVALGTHRFSYKELFHATRGFSDKRLLGKGGFGSVYKGVLHKSAMEVAVKKVSHESKQGMEEFLTEASSIGQLRHRNLVQLLGYCRRKGELLLVYDYMPNGSLDKYLYDRSKGTLDWPQRFHIIRGVASGLLYLHEEWEQIVIHRDVKASNVLLDSGMNGRLGDFGLARLYEHGDDPQTTRVVGTMGYLAPELGHTGKATPATDVFSFGAFLLEVTCGRRPIEEDEHNNRVVLVDWVAEHWRRGLIIDAADTMIPNGFDPEEITLVLKLGLMCSHPLPNARPSMRQVIQYLDGDKLLPNLSPTSLNFAMVERMVLNARDKSSVDKDKSVHAAEAFNTQPIVEKSQTKQSFRQRMHLTGLYFAAVSQKETMLSKLVPSVVLLLLLHLAASGDDGGSQFVYHGFAAANLTLDGLAAVTPGGLLELTNGKRQAKGHAFHPAPLHLLISKTAAAGNSTAAPQSFSTCFVFAIVSPVHDGVISDHGLAFVIAPTTDLPMANAGGQYLGLLNTANGSASDRILAVELDTIMNPELRDIDSNHVGIDVNSLISQQASPVGYYNDDAGGAFQELRLNSREPMQVWVDYDGQARQLDVTLAPVRVPKPTRPLLSMNIDLSTVIADPVYVGFSSANSIMLTSHCVLGWSFSLDDGPASPLDFSKLPALPRLGPKPRSKVFVVVLPLTVVALVAAVLATVFLIVWRRRRRYAEEREDWEDEFGPHRFSYKDLFHATDGFKDSNLLGVGGFGRVYKGVLPPSNLEIAVKKVSHDSRQGVREFVAEVVSIGRIRHRNLVQLLGYCRRKGELLLVYDYMANGSLDRYLHDQQLPSLSWNERYRIIKGVAASLLYLHEDCEQVVIHRDIKSSNVLLDHEMNSKLSDFGLAKLYDHGTDPQSTHIAGTVGFLAPELIRTGKATPLTDVFAFGVFLLEVACGRRPIDHDDRNNRIVLLDWVIQHHHNGSILDVVDPRLVGKYEKDEVILVLKLGLICAHPLPNMRPSMRRVMQYLDSSQSIPDLSLIQNEAFDPYANLPDLSMASIGASSVTILLEGR